MGNFKSQLEREFKEKRHHDLSDEKKEELKIKSIDDVVKDIDAKRNRYIFYCPDIILVNPLLKIVYEVALQVKNAGYNVVMLHEMNGFKAKWLYESEDYAEYRSLNVEYIMKKPSKKSKKEKNMYAFRVSDTLVVTDAFQDMLQNILSEPALKLVQKVVLVTGYMGIASISPGTTYDKLDVSSLIFFDDNIKNDYSKLFSTKNYIINNYPISKGFKRDVVIPSEVAPVIGITSIGNNEKANQLINVFYNRYPNLSMFTFKIIARDNIDLFINNVATSAAVIVLDKNIVTKQMFYECLNMGVLTIVPKRREFLDNKTIIENFVVEDDVFDMADSIAEFCTHWLNTPTSSIKNDMIKLADELDLSDRTMEAFGETVSSIFYELQESRSNMFTNMRNSITKK